MKAFWLVAGVTPVPGRRLLGDCQTDLHAAGASVHDAGHLPRLAVQVEVQIQIQGVPEDIHADAPAGQGVSRLASSPWHPLLTQLGSSSAASRSPVLWQ